MKKKTKALLSIPVSIILLAIIVFAPVYFNTLPLSLHEFQIAETMFGKNLELEKIRINKGGPLTWIYPGVTIGHIISFPKGGYDQTETKDEALFLHELTHVWQYENIGWAYAPRALYEEISQSDAYVIHYDENKSFLEYDLEEQAEIVADYYLYQTEEYQKYIWELQFSHLLSKAQGFDLAVGEIKAATPSNDQYIYLATAQGGGYASFIYDVQKNEVHYLGNEAKGIGEWLEDGTLEMINYQIFGEDIGSIESIYHSISSEEPWLIEE